jgi:probable rRNA maturation factor
MFEVDVLNEAGYAVDEERLKQAAITVLSRNEVQDGSSLTVAITNNEEVARLNQDYRGIDAPTDVLSFPMDGMPGDTPYLGDLVIAYPYASDQAQRLGHRLGDSLGLLVVHGTLHLLGYDHDTVERRAQMWAAQEGALIELGIPVEIVPTLEEGDHDDAQG